MRDHDVRGAFGRAWEHKGDGEGVAQWRMESSMGSWLLHCPQAHPFWAWHLVGGVHLRPHADEDEPLKFQFPGATHEIYVMALNPERDAELDPDDPRTWHWLTPPDVAQQVILGDDDQARKLVTLCAFACCSGLLIPDSDFRQHWADTLAMSSEHLRLGGHPGQEAQRA